MIYTNAIESMHRGLRKIIKTRGAFPSDEAATKLLYLALRNLGVHWKPAVEWRAAYAQFSSLTACQLQSADDQPPMDRSHTITLTLSITAIMAKASITRETWRCHPCQDLLSL